MTNEELNALADVSNTLRGLGRGRQDFLDRAVVAIAAGAVQQEGVMKISAKELWARTVFDLAEKLYEERNRRIGGAWK